MLIAFRTDSSRQIGTGHLMRCLTLADELARRGHRTHFICRDLEGNINALARDRGHALTLLSPPSSTDAGKFDQEPLPHARWLGVAQEVDAEHSDMELERVQSTVDWLVVDHYALDARWETRLRSSCKRIMVIDDLADRPHSCDLLLDQNFYPDTQSRYQGLIPSGCDTLFGPRFALLRQEFAAARGKLRDRGTEVRRVLILFGGIDEDNETLKTLEALTMIGDPRISADVVIGRENPHQDVLRRYCVGRTDLRLHVQTEQIAELMAAADLAVGGGGVATWERCALGLPAIVWPLADNQRSVISSVADYGAVYAPNADTIETPQELSKHIFALIHSAHLRHHLGTSAASLCDGGGTRRVTDLLAPVEVALRPATMDDCEDLHRWRNHPETRRASVDSQIIPYPDHRTWYERTLADPRRELLIAEQNGSPAGVLRYDLDGETAVVSLYLVPGMSGKGTGTSLLRAGESWMRKSHPEVKQMRAVVLDVNAPSKAVFERCGFSRHHVVYEKACQA